MIIKRTLLILVVLCVYTSAMAPINGVKKDDVNKRICEPLTPCSWSVYKDTSKMVSMIIPNTYCVCGPGKGCVIDGDDTENNTFVHRCKPTTK